MTTHALVHAPVVHDGGEGRPHYSDKVRKAVLTGLRLGLTRQAAAGRAGVHRETLRVWIRDNDEFRQAVEQAEDTAESRYTVILANDALREHNAQTAIRWLERRRPAGWRESLKLIETEEEVAAQVDDDEFADRLRAIAGEIDRRRASAASGDVRDGSEAPEGAS